MLQDKIQQWLFSYQLAWLRDPSSWLIARKPRGVGFTEAGSFRSLLHCLRHDGHTYFLVSTKTGNARRQILDRIKNRWIPLLEADPDTKHLVEGARLNKNEIHLPNGSSLIASANAPERFRGNESCSYLFDEMAFWERRVQVGLEDAVWPQIQNPHNPHSEVQIISTVWTKQDNLYHDIEQNIGGHYPQFSRHHLDIHDAVEAGYPIDVEKIRSRTPSDKWSREYLALYAQFGGGYFSHDALVQLASDPPKAEGSKYIGVDLGKINDFTSVVVLDFHPSRTPAAYVDRVYMMRSVNFDEQGERILDIIEEVDPSKAEVDITAHQSFGDTIKAKARARGLDSRSIKTRHFTNKWKVDQTEKLRRWVDNGNVEFNFDEVQSYESGSWIDEHRRWLLDDLCRVQQSSTASGKQKYDVPRQPGDTSEGHADSYSALLCAMSAADSTGGYIVGRSSRAAKRAG